MDFKFTSKELRKAWLNFYKERGHVDCGAVSLIGDGTTGVMFNVAGMQPLMPYLLGKRHPMGTRLTNVQGCVQCNFTNFILTSCPTGATCNQKTCGGVTKYYFTGCQDGYTAGATKNTCVAI